MSPAASDARSVVLAYLAALNAHDADGAADLVTEDFVNEHTSVLAASGVGREVYRRRVPGFLATMVGLHYEVEDTIAEGDKVAVPYILTATVDGHPIRIRGMFRFVVRDGLVAHRVDYWDSKDYERQVGTA